MPCRSCGAELIAGKQFCHACGEPVRPSCASCGADLDGEFRFCPDCGAPVGAPVESEPGGAELQRADDSLLRFSRAMPAGLAEKLSESGRTIRGERKVVTVLFCDLAGSTAVAERLDPEEYRELLDQYLEIAFREIYRFEGIVNQLAGDGLMALFGAPIAHEDDAQRALWAALAIRDAMVDFNRKLAARDIQLPARIGVNTGPVVAGAVGNDLKMDYTAVGDTTNLAARLESLAEPGSILISDETERLARAFFRMRPAGPFEVKGKSDLVAAFEVLEAVDATSPMAVATRRGLTPFVGRDAELAQLIACFDRLEQGLPQVVELVGDAGSGKSRLIHELREQLAAGDVTFFEARCAALHQPEPYYPFISMLRSFFGLTDDTCEAEAKASVAEKTGMDPAKVEREFPHLKRLLSQRELDSSEVPIDELQQETTRALGDLVLREARRAPVVVIFEDLHWADEQSRELLEMALGGLHDARVMIVISSRPDEVYRWGTKAALTRIYLRPLSNRAMDEIMRNIVGGALPEVVTKRVRERAEGSPFFVEEITRSLVERGLIRCGADGCEVAGDVDQIVIPGSVREVLAARLDRLAPAAKRAAQLGAILGRQFSRDDVAELLEANGEKVSAALGQLVERGVVHRVGASDAAEYRFGESLTQDVAYESLLLKERRALHEKVGEMLNGHGARASIVAYHYARSANETKAIDALLEAAAEAERLPAFRAASDLYRQAWEIAESHAERSGLQSRERLLEAALGYCRMLVLYGSSEDPLAREAAELSIALATDLGQKQTLATAKTFYGMILTTDPEEFDRGLRSVEEGVEAARVEGNQELVNSASRALGWNYLLDGRFEEAIDSLEQTMARQLAIDESGTLGEIYLSARMMQQQVRCFADDLDGSFEQAKESIELARAAGNRTVETSSLSQLGYIEFLRGNYEKSLEWAKAGFERSEEIGIEWGIRKAAIQLVAVHAEIDGEAPPARVVSLAEQGIAMGGNIVLSILPLVEGLVGLLKFRRAETLAREALAHSAGRLRIMFSSAALGDSTLRLGEEHWDESEHCFAESLRIAEAISSKLGQAVSLNGLGKLAFVRGRPTEAEVHFTRALEISRAAGLGRYSQRAERMLGEAKEASLGAARSEAVPA